MKIEEIKGGKLISEDKIFLCVEDKVTGIVYPHPLTNFIKSVYNQSQSLNSQKSAGEEIKKFLNYVLENIEEEEGLFETLELEGLKGLRLIHGASYISFLTRRVKSGEIQGNYVYRIEQYLVKFYKWLSEQKIIDEIVEIKEKTKVIKGESIKILISPFNNFELGTEYPNKKENNKEDRLHDFGAGRFDLMNLFLKVAKLEAPDIALGIAIQFYGGLRRSEVTNLLRGSISEPKANSAEPFTIQIADNWRELFPNKKITVSEQVKNPRTQVVIKVPIIMELYSVHKENLTRLEEKGKLKHKQALFCSKHTGRPISGTAYWERFNKVKKKFLEIVLDKSLEDYQFLTSKSWSTHIGRGIYTNMLTFTLGWNASETAIARGDNNIKSAQAYIEEQNIIQKTHDAIEILARASAKHEKEKYNTIEGLRDA